MRTLARLLIALIVPATTLLAFAHQEARHVVVRGTQVLLAPPTGFAPARRYSGFESEATGASIMVAELPGPYAEIAKGMNEQGLRRGGMTLVASESLAVAGTQGLLLRAKQTSNGLEFGKWILVFGDAQRTIQVVANFLETSAAELEQPLRAVVAGARWDRALVVDPFAFLSFTIAVPGELKFFARVQNALLFTRTGQANKDAPQEPLFTVAPSLSAVDVGDLEAAAKRRLSQYSKVREVAIESSAALELAGRRAWEFVATAKDSKSGAGLVLHQVLLLDGEGYYLFFGSVGADGRDTYLPVFRSAVRSFAFKSAESDERK
jgi:hypothetical protein